MQGAVIITKINVRAQPNISNTDVGDLYRNEKVYGVVTNGWIKFERVYKTNGVIDDGVKGYAAVHNPTNPAELYMELTDAAEPGATPEPEPTIKPLVVVITGEDYESVTVTLNPKQ